VQYWCNSRDRGEKFTKKLKVDLIEGKIIAIKFKGLLRGSIALDLNIVLDIAHHV
jgi:hypothetical protein